MQLFSGLLKRRCIGEDTGIALSDDVCNECPDGFICAKTLSNPQNDLISFDSFGWALTQVLIVTTLGGWNTTLKHTAAALSEAVVIYYVIIVLVGGFFLVNLTLAIIKLNFSNNQAKVPEQIPEDSYPYWELRELGIYEPNRLNEEAPERSVFKRKSIISKKVRGTIRKTTIMASTKIPLN